MEGFLRLLKFIAAFSVALCIAFCSCDGYVATVSQVPVIILDAGHGGEDPGAVGYGDIYEKDLNLAICRILYEELRARGYVAVMTREEDRLLYTEAENIKGIRKISDLKNRVKIFNSYESAIAVSIHMNSFSESKYHGTQIYYSAVDGARELATAIQDVVRREVQPDNKRPLKHSEGIYLLEHTEIPAVLVECGFLSNPEECKKLSEKEYQKQLSFSIVCVIINYIEEN